MSRGGAPSGYPGDWQSGRNPDATECAGSHGTLNPGPLHLPRMPSSLSHFFLPAILGGVALPTVVGTPTSPQTTFSHLQISFDPSRYLGPSESSLQCSFLGVTQGTEPGTSDIHEYHSDSNSAKNNPANNVRPWCNECWLNNS
ncbi:hypothetical protein PCANC_08421 [Puccinia coronata f. sp. avenae]|uniref:Uncharacterized protein n=1 Tax=Puccinia coronata f. sp. avenae TaxID=200324 RepID=A0A2N5T5V0_9BASI|nr:hypothetical protein PCASD_25589 [Puccinia coronata f. sp. avenae]PLW20850.1 hypothetical protein PCANC_08239 [Puccinia coronata f. sp. avenae]PLW51970.1 hypothetical protein PCANC_08421 [Puccinia coronata f. sp. avenae]